MAATDFGALSDAKVTLWAAETWQEGRDQSFFMSNGFMGKGGKDKSNQNRPIEMVNKLTKTTGGTKCVMQLVQDLQGDGVAGDNELEGNEEALVNDAQTIQVDQLRHGIRSKGEMAEQETVIRFRAQSRNKLSFWLGDKIDEMMFLVAAGRAFSVKNDGSARGASQLTQLNFASDVVAASTNRIIHAGSATSEASITAADKMSWDLIVQAKAFATRQKIKPIREGGQEFYAVCMSTEQRRDLVLDQDYKDIVSRAAQRGSNNPLFKNAMAVVDGVILYAHNKVYNTLGLGASSKWGAGGTIDGAQAKLFGAQSLGFAQIENAFMRESDNTDYGNRQGIAFGRKIGMLKPQFITANTAGVKEDFGMVAVKTAAAA